MLKLLRRRAAIGATFIHFTYRLGFKNRIHHLVVEGVIIRCVKWRVKCVACLRKVMLLIAQERRPLPPAPQILAPNDRAICHQIQIEPLRELILILRRPDIARQD